MNLRFGIPSLDAILVGRSEREALANARQIGWGGILLSEKSEGTSVCLIGPDGTGKSVFSMHLASQYLWDCRQTVSSGTGSIPKVIYVSTDLRYEMAERMFAAFHLSRPIWARSDPSSPRIRLRKLPTGDASELADYLLGSSANEIGFVDLASDTAGDDWALVTRIVSLLEEQETEHGLRHLLVIDAIEGLETLAGETDAYGQKVSRRARIALLMRLASHKCHLALVVEETKSGVRLPEEFVADIVIRLRSTLINGYNRRTLEVEKARGQSHHARGQHPFQIRSGKRPTAAPMPESADDALAEIVIYPSLHYQGKALRERSLNSTGAEPPLVSFGIRHLDSLLKQSSNGQFGLPGGRPFALIGDKGTFKSYLADAFLAPCFADIAASFVPQLDTDRWRAAWARAGDSAGVAILATSKPRSHGDLEQAVIRQLLDSNPQAREILTNAPEQVRHDFSQWMHSHLRARIQLDSLAIQDQPGPRMFHRVNELIENAKVALAALPSLADQNYRIRLVFDDLSGFRDAYPELHNDPLLLPLVIQLSRLERVSTLLVATQPTESDTTQLPPFDATLRALVDGFLLTWRVSFFGEARTAITFVAGSQGDRQPTIREVYRRPLNLHPGHVVTDVDPEFELYDGLEAGRPQPVPLEIRLYIETPAFREYVDRENQLLRELFPAAKNSNGLAEVITCVDSGGYDALRDYCYLSASGRLPNTLIVQVDEFWRPAKRLGMLADLKEYVSTRVDSADAADPYEDHYAVFRLSDQAKEKEMDEPNSADEYPKVRTRRHFFPEFRRPGPPEEFEVIDRLPFMWDFGFLLLSHNDWHSAEQVPLPILRERLWALIPDRSRWDNQPWPEADAERGRPATHQHPECQTVPFRGVTVGTVLDALRKPNKHLRARSDQVVQEDRRMMTQLAADGCLFRGPSSWRAVLEATAEVRRRRIARDTTAVRPFDIARPSGESFSSLVLEIWLSEILERQSWKIRRAAPSDKSAHQSTADQFLAKLNSFDPREQYSIEELVDKFALELYMTWMLLVEVIDFNCLVDRDHRFTLAEQVDPTPAMAARHWYKTAAAAPSARYSEEPCLPARLPGYFSTRGDWFLAMAAGSRSYRLGTRALDLLSSRRANITRLQEGLGLPVRDIVNPCAFERFRTKLSYVNHRGRRSTVDYGALISLGAESTRSYLCPTVTPASPDSSIDLGRLPFAGLTNPSDSFYWIFRSRIRGYDRHARIWTKWLVRVTLLMQGIMNEESAVWRNGFAVYDDIALADEIPPPVRELRSCTRFFDMAEFLKHELRWADAGHRS
jgi:KaiC/GvpD/RAD55 family RecA-like ATPase